MSDLKPHAGCHSTCPYLETVTGSCGHSLRLFITKYLAGHPDESCPVYESARAEEMKALAEQMDVIVTEDTSSYPLRLECPECSYEGPIGNFPPGGGGDRKCPSCGYTQHPSDRDTDR
jgi:hypothetical protein